VHSRCLPHKCRLSGEVRNPARPNAQSDLNSVIPAQASSRMINRTPFGPRCLRLSRWSWHSHSGFTTRNATTMTSNKQATTRCVRLNRVRECAWMDPFSMFTFTIHVHKLSSKSGRQPASYSMDAAMLKFWPTSRFAKCSLVPGWAEKSKSKCRSCGDGRCCAR